MRLHLDYETASDLNLKKTGAYKYAQHHSTRILMLGWAFDDEPVALWEPHKGPIPPRLEQGIRDSAIDKHAFNVAFERLITRHCLGIEVPPEQWRCSMVEASYLGFTGGLDKCLKAVGLPPKDARGNRLIGVFCTPAAKNHKADWYNWDNKPLEWPEFCQYCIQDVDVERRLWHWMQRFPRILDWDYKQWCNDQRINDRGVPMDVEMAASAIDIWELEKADITATMIDMMGIPKVTRDPFLVWMQDNTGVVLESTRKDYLANLLHKGTLPPEAEPYVKLWAQKEGKATSKYNAIVNGTCDDGRARGMFQYKGAARTDRVGGRLIQLQNLKRPLYGDSAQSIANVVEAIKCRDPKFLAMLHPHSVSEILGGSIRHALSASEGHSFAICDLTSIESVILGWIAQCPSIDATFRAGKDSYRMFASKYYNIPYEAVTKAQRSFSKPPVLGCGFLLGWKGLIAYAEGYGVDMTQKQAKDAVDTFRGMYPEIPKFWKWIGEAVKYVTSTHIPCDGYNLRIERDNEMLRIWLPSGRALSYFTPEVRRQEAPWSTPEKPAYIDNFTYMGMNDKNQWVRISAHPGGITENCCAGDTLVMTRRGWITIADVRLDDEVFDGMEFVRHAGTVYKSVQSCVNIDGILMTDDHEVLTNAGWKSASSLRRPYRSEIRYVDRDSTFSRRWERLVLGVPLRLRGNSNETGWRREEGRQGWRVPELWVHDEATDRREEPNSRDDESPSILGMAKHDRSVQATFAPVVAQLRRAGDLCVRTLAGLFRGFLGGHGASVQEGTHARAGGQFSRLQQGKLQLEGSHRTSEQPQGERSHPNTEGLADSGAGVQPVRDKSHHVVQPCEDRVPRAPDAIEGVFAQPVYDIINAGPRRRFVVKGDSGPFIVHNCVQSIAGDILWRGIMNATEAGLPVVLHVHDEIAVEVPDAQADAALLTLQACMVALPDWCSDMWLGADGFVTKRYTKD